MAYAHVIDGKIEALRGPGRLEAKLADGRQLGAPDGVWTPELAALCGFVEIATAERPDDTEKETSDRTVEMIDGTPTEVWTVRSKTEAELAPVEILIDPTEVLQAKIAGLEAALQVVARPMVDDVKTTDEERDKLAALFADVPDAERPVAVQAVVRTDTIPLDLGGDAAKTKVSIPKGQHD